MTQYTHWYLGFIGSCCKIVRRTLSPPYIVVNQYLTEGFGSCQTKRPTTLKWLAGAFFLRLLWLVALGFCVSRVQLPTPITRFQRIDEAPGSTCPPQLHSNPGETFWPTLAGLRQCSSLAGAGSLQSDNCFNQIWYLERRRRRLGVSAHQGTYPASQCPCRIVRLVRKAEEPGSDRQPALRQEACDAMNSSLQGVRSHV